MYLTVNENRSTSLWEKKPVYSPATMGSFGMWSLSRHPRMATITTSGRFLPLEKIAADLEIVPGEEGILEVTMSLVPVDNAATRE